MKTSDIASYCYLAVSWGFSFFVVVQSIEAFGWVGAITFRCLIAGVTIYAAGRLSGRPMVLSGKLRPLAVVGVSSVALQLVGLTYATPVIGTAMTAIMVPTIPLYSMLIAQAWGIERMTMRGAAGLGLGIAGIVMLVGFPAVEITFAFVLGCIAALAGTFGAAFGSVYASRTLGNAGTWELTAGSFLIGGLLTLPLLALVPVPAMPEPLDFLWLAISGSVMSGVNYLVYFRMVGRIGATRAVSVEFLVTVIAVIVGTALLGEALTLVQAAGAVIIIAGCMTVLGLFGGRAASA